MTQPPLSRQIQKLEKSVGVTLVERDNRKVSLTAAGTAFLDEARKLLITAEQAPFTARRIAQGQAGILRIGFTATSGFSILGTLLTRLSKSLPDVDLDLRELVTSEQLQSLIDGDLDLGLGRPPFDNELFASRVLQSESLLLAIPDGHHLAEGNHPVSEHDLRGVPLIMHSPIKARYFYDLAIRHMPVEHGNVIHTVSQILTMVSLVAAGRGVAFVPESARRLGIRGVTYRPIAGEAPGSVELHAIWRRGARNPALRRVADLLAQEAPLSHR